MQKRIQIKSPGMSLIRPCPVFAELCIYYSFITNNNKGEKSKATITFFFHISIILFLYNMQLNVTVFLIAISLKYEKSISSNKYIGNKKYIYLINNTVINK